MFLNVQLERTWGFHHLRYITSFKESEEISVHILDGHDLRALRWHFIKNRHGSVVETTACPQTIVWEHSLSLHPQMPVSD